MQAKEAMLPCGTVRVGDVVVLRSGDAARVVCFWGHNDDIAAELEFYTKVDDTKWLAVEGGAKQIADADHIVDAVAYAPLGGGVIRVILPARVKLGLV